MDSSRRQGSSTRTGSGEPAKGITPAFCCSCYLTSIFFFLLIPFIIVIILVRLDGNHFCYLDLFADSVSVTSTNVTTSDWRFVLVAKSPLSNCKTSLHTIKSSLLQGDEVISQLSPWVNGLGQLFTFDKRVHNPVTSVDFDTVVMKPGVVVSGLVWDFRVEIVAAVKTDVGRGYLNVNCRGIPVNFTSDGTGNMVNGLMLGNRRRCDYVYRKHLDRSV